MSNEPDIIDNEEDSPSDESVYSSDWDHQEFRAPWARKGREWSGWSHDRSEYRRPLKLFIRFVMTLGFVIFSVALGMGVLAYLLSRLFGGDGQIGTLVWLGGCSLSIGFPIMAVVMAMRAFRSFARPLGNVMEAADRVAEGDFEVQVSEEGPRDVRQLANSFNRMTAELARADQQRRNLTADVAHELRTPLHILQGNLEGILDGVYEPNEAHVKAMLEETQLLAHLIDDLQTLSLAEAGELPMHIEVVNLNEFFSDLKTSLVGPARQAGVDLKIEPAEAFKVHADPSRLDQILGNLIGNALRHTPSGGQITIRTRAGEAEIVQITVQDSGEGIPEEDLPYIFDRFWKGDRARTRGSGARSGLGLAITRQLTRTMAGSIHVESEIGSGTTFQLELPAAQN